jgi:hypothetical protein
MDLKPNLLPTELPTSSAKSYRDELNFAEFPIASVADRIPSSQKTLTFTDTIFDQSRNARVSRKLTISGSDHYGLPTALDDEVILALIQLTSSQGFSTKKVHFTLYQLIQLLGWRDDGRSYKRLIESLKRWVGVTLEYDRAWWAKEERSWESENFHILEEVTIVDRSRRERRKAAFPEDPNAVKSYFVWNEKVYNSFLAGNLKQLNFEFFKSLDGSIAKRMFRFLDKRFYLRRRWDFDLRVFSCEHIGLSRSNSNSELKRLLSTAIRELEVRGFLEPLDPEARFTEVRRGEWTINFLIHPQWSSSGPAELTNRSTPEQDGVVVPLRSPKRVVSKPTARERITRPEHPVAVGPETRDPPLGPKHRKEDARRALLRNLWEEMNEGERRQLESAALERGSSYLVRQYHEAKARGGSLFESVREVLVYQELQRRLSS